MDKKYDYVATKVPQFSFTRLAGADPYLGVEMASTGEVTSFGKNALESYWTAIQSTMNFNVPLPPSGILFGGDLSKNYLGEVVKYIAPLGYKLYATNEETKKYLESYSKDAKVDLIEFPENDKRKLRELFQAKDISAVFNLAAKRAETLEDVDYAMRRNAIDFALPLFNEPQTAMLFAKSLNLKLKEKLMVLESKDVVVPKEVRTWSEYLNGKPL